MRKLTVTIVSLVLALTAVAGCDDSTDPYDDDLNPTTFTGTIDGGAWTPTTPLASRSGSATVTVSVFGTDAQGRQITVTITGVTGAGTYNIGNGQPAAITLNIGSQAWVGHLAGATGSVVLSTLTTTYMTGTLNVTLVPQTATGATGNKVLTGSFTAYFGQT